MLPEVGEDLQQPLVAAMAILAIQHIDEVPEEFVLGRLSRYGWLVNTVEDRGNEYEVLDVCNMSPFVDVGKGTRAMPIARTMDKEQVPDF